MRAIKSDFPFFSSNQSKNAPTIYVDNAATTQKPQAVLDAMVTFYTHHNANVGRGVYALAERATMLYEQAREKVRQFIGAQHASEIIFTKGATESINLVAQVWALEHLKEGDEIVLTELEHHANLLPWQRVAQQVGAILRFIPVKEDGQLDYSALDTLLTHKTRLVAITHISNAIGTIVNVNSIITRAHSVGAKVLVDASQSIPHLNINVAAMQADFLVFSGHKMLGPTGIGVLYIQADIHDQLQPYQRGGGMVFAADWHDAIWLKMPHMLEAGTPPIAQAIGLAAAIDYLESLDREQLQRHEAALCARFIEGLAALPQVRILGPIEQLRTQGHLVSFVVQDMHAHDVAAYLDQKNICVRAGHHCAQPLATKLNYVASIRVSFYIYNTIDEVNYILKVLEEIVRK